MAKEMKHQSWDLHTEEHRRTSVPVKYPWGQWLNGSMWYLVAGEDFDLEITQFQTYVYNYCYAHDIKVKTKLTRDKKAIFIKAYGQTSKNSLRRRAHFAKLEARLEEKKKWEAKKKEWEDEPDEEDEQAEGS